MKQLLKRGLRMIFDDYELNRIYYVDLDTTSAGKGGATSDGTVIRRLESPREYASSPDGRIRDHAWYYHQYAQAYGLFEGDALMCVCCFWTKGHPQMPQRFSSLEHSEAVMVDLLTAPQSRSKGYALAVTRFAERDLRSRGYTKLWTWVWHSNAASIRVFTKAGWSYSHFLAEFRVRGRANHWRLRLPMVG